YPTLHSETEKMTTSGVEGTVKLVQFILYIPIFSLGLIFNALAIWILIFKIRKWSETTTYMANLITCNSLLLFCLPFKIAAFKQNPWLFGWQFCLVLESLYFLNMYGSILVTTSLIVDRYIAIIHPFIAKSIRSPKIAAAVCALIWVSVLGGISVTYKFHNMSNDNITCFYGYSNATWEKAELISSLETVFSISAVIIVFCSARIIISLKNLGKMDPLYRKANKSIMIVLANLVTFLICFTPYHVCLLLHYLAQNSFISNHGLIKDLTHVSLCLANANCCLDAFCFYYVVKEF
uniref:G-protein coupled receptors family 1 profile domain-containing protein n=1 Tax=Latimeria chalumnae TaxID=7897 RepID=H3A895_LATCH